MDGSIFVYNLHSWKIDWKIRVKIIKKWIVNTQNNNSQLHFILDDKNVSYCIFIFNLYQVRSLNYFVTTNLTLIYMFRATRSKEQFLLSFIQSLMISKQKVHGNV